AGQQVVAGGYRQGIQQHRQPVRGAGAVLCPVSGISGAQCGVRRGAVSGEPVRAQPVFPRLGPYALQPCADTAASVSGGLPDPAGDARCAGLGAGDTLRPVPFSQQAVRSPRQRSSALAGGGFLTTGDQRASSASMASSRRRSSAVTSGEKRATTSPWRLTRNFSKFHSTSFGSAG